MCSAKCAAWFGPDAKGELTAAVVDVAALNFFSAAEPCDGPRFDALASAEPDWLTARVVFDEEHRAGAVTCRMPEPLAVGLFDAFNGRQPGDPPPDRGDLFDLVGEFANMTCGAWLTRIVAEHAFVLGRPIVARVGGDGPLRDDEQSVLLTVDDRPLAVTIELDGGAARGREV